MEPIIPVIDGKTALAMLAEAIERNGSECVYRNPNEYDSGPTGCVYIHGTRIVTEGRDEYGDPVEVEISTDNMEPGCIIGNALVGRGVPMEKFVELNVNSDTPIGHLIRAFQEYGVIGSVTLSAIEVLTIAQETQDRGKSWGHAYIQARENLKMYED